MSVSNQKIVTITKANSDKDNIYGIVNIDAAQKASRTLKAGAFRLWIYFNLQQDGYRFELSSKYLNQTWGIGIKQYNAAIGELIDNGYLTQKRENSNLFDFDECGKINDDVNQETVQNEMKENAENNESFEVFW